MPRGPLLLSAAACVFASTTLILTTYTLILTPPSSGKVDARILELLHSLEGQLRTHTGASEAGQTAEHVGRSMHCAADEQQVFLEKVSKLEKELEEARAQLVTPRLKNEQTKFLALIGVPLRISDSALRDSIRLGWAQYPQVCQRVPKCAATCSVHVRFVLGIEGDGSKEDALLLIEQENKTHGDLVFLPEVRDKKGANMDHSSKMWRWISHAAEHFAHFTFLVKADSDTFVFVDSLLKQLVPLPPVQVYGGMPVGWLACGAEPHCPQNYVYAAGALEVLSLDVASWISRSEWIKAQEPHGPEDLLLGKWLIEPESTAQHDFHTGWFPIVNCWLHEKRFKHAQGHLDMAKDPAVSAAVNVPCGS